MVNANNDLNNLESIARFDIIMNFDKKANLFLHAFAINTK